MAPLAIHRDCPGCSGEGYRDDYPDYVEDTRCRTCKGNGYVFIPLTSATNQELSEAARQRWELCGEATEMAQAYAREAQEIEAEQARRRK